MRNFHRAMEDAMAGRGLARRNLIRGAAIFGFALAALGAVTAQAADKVSVVMDAGFNGRHAYYFVAIEKGYYEAAGLDVQVMRGQGSADAIKQVAAGNA